MIKNNLSIFLSRQVSKAICLIVFILTWAFALGGLNAWAEPTQAGIKIAVVNTEFIINNSEKFILAKKDLDNKYSYYREELIKSEQEVSELYSQISDPEHKLSNEELIKLKTRLNIKESYLQKNHHQKMLLLDNELSSIIDVVEKDIEDILTSFIKERKYDLVLRQKNLIYANNDYDITSEVLEQINLKSKTPQNSGGDSEKEAGRH